MVWQHIIVSVVIVSLLSFTGAIALAFKKELLKKVLMILVAFSTGALIGDAFLHLIPEAISEAGKYKSSTALFIFVGILLFFSLEKFLRWRHCHDIDCKEHPKHLGTMNLVGDGVHNFIDGILIAASYVVSIPLGISTTIAVAAHEIPQELGDFGVLIHSGFRRKQAIIFNFVSASFAIVGAIFVLLVGSVSSEAITYIIPISAGGFIYIALSGLIPELHKEENIGKSFIQFLSIVAGIAIMYLLLLLDR